LTKLSERQRDHGLFVAFAPVENPQIAVAVIVENGNSGSGAAAPVARQVLDAWLLGQTPVNTSNLPADNDPVNNSDE
jgi:penicillin-binding protein 2